MTCGKASGTGDGPLLGPDDWICPDPQLRKDVEHVVVQLRLASQRAAESADVLVLRLKPLLSDVPQSTPVIHLDPLWGMTKDSVDGGSH